MSLLDPSWQEIAVLIVLAAFSTYRKRKAQPAPRWTMNTTATKNLVQCDYYENKIDTNNTVTVQLKKGSHTVEVQRISIRAEDFAEKLMDAQNTASQKCAELNALGA